jgi:hypothetical protein
VVLTAIEILFKDELLCFKVRRSSLQSACFTKYPLVLDYGYEVGFRNFAAKTEECNQQLSLMSVVGV